MSESNQACCACLSVIGTSEPVGLNTGWVKSIWICELCGCRYVKESLTDPLDGLDPAQVQELSRWDLGMVLVLLGKLHGARNDAHKWEDDGMIYTGGLGDGGEAHNRYWATKARACLKPTDGEESK